MCKTWFSWAPVQDNYQHSVSSTPSTSSCRTIVKETKGPAMFEEEGSTRNEEVEGKGGCAGGWGVTISFRRNPAEVSVIDSISSLVKSSQSLQRFLKQQCYLNTQCFSHTCALIPPALPKPAAKKNLEQSQQISVRELMKERHEVGELGRSAGNLSPQGSGRFGNLHIIKTWVKYKKEI